MIGDKYKARIERDALHNDVRRKPLERRRIWRNVADGLAALLIVLALLFLLLLAVLAACIGDGLR